MKRYVLVGTGMRGTLSYMVPMIKDLSDCVELTAVYDVNPKRAKAAVEYVKKTVENLNTAHGDAENIKILGRGILDNSKNTEKIIRQQP